MEDETKAVVMGKIKMEMKMKIKMKMEIEMKMEMKYQRSGFCWLSASARLGRGDSGTAP